VALLFRLATLSKPFRSYGRRKLPLDLQRIADNRSQKFPSPLGGPHGI
jgi:hypothetical protein